MSYQSNNNTGVNEMDKEVIETINKTKAILLAKKTEYVNWLKCVSDEYMAFVIECDGIYITPEMNNNTGFLKWDTNPLKTKRYTDLKDAHEAGKKVRNGNGTYGRAISLKVAVEREFDMCDKLLDNFAEINMTPDP